MLKLKLIKRIAGKIVFNYYPEGKEIFGTISVDERTGEMDVVRVSENDEFGRYKLHALKRIREFINGDTFTEEDIVAWY